MELNNNLPQNLFQLLSKYKVVVPLIQRDYVQGSNKTICDSILSDIYNAIKTNSTVDFNFIYGKIENELFYPIDGQQRLTTLFLLHLYAFRNTNEDVLNNFSYKARNSSNDFIENLIKNKSTIFNNSIKPSKNIEDSYWYDVNWSYDPTVKSVKRILDCINNKFNDVENLDEILKDKSKCPVIFQFTELDEKYGNANELYIKLNSRGKILNPFENFKAQLIERACQLKYDKIKAFEDKLDGTWYELIWNHLKDEKDGIQKVDDIYFNLFKLAFLSDDIDIEKEDYINELTQNSYNKISKLLDYVSSDESSQIIKDFLFRTLNEINIVNKAYYYFIYKFASVSNVNQYFEGCMRVVHNLISNSQIDKEELLVQCKKGIDKVVEHYDSILNYISECDLNELKGFDGYQKTEEQLKAKLILKNQSFYSVFIKAESNEYFGGQIGSAIKMSNLDIEENINLFNQYWDKITLFFDKKKSRYSSNQLFRRTMLSMKDYTLRVSDYYTFCADDPNELKRTPSLKRLFLEKYDFIKELLDRIDVKSDIEGQLNGIINSNISKITIKDWRFCFINCPEIFDDMAPEHLRIKKEGNEIIIIPNKSSTGKNLNAYLQYILHKANKRIVFQADGEQGTNGDRYITNNKVKIRQQGLKLSITNMLDEEKQSFDIDNNFIKNIMDYLIDNNLGK